VILGRLCRLQRASWEVFEFLNYNLISFFLWAFVAGNDVKQELKSLLARRGHSRRENVLKNSRAFGFDG
jgi:hypothetical protein